MNKEVKKSQMKISCCNEVISFFEDGVNGSDFYKCEKCGKTYNVIEGSEELN